MQIADYVKGKSWAWYLPVWLVGLYVFCVLLRFDPNKQLPLIILPAQSFDFMLHEMAHILTGFLPSILTAAAGSFSELLLGVVLIITAFKSRSYFAVLICSLWFMLASQSVGTYMADARAQKMDLVSLGGAMSGSETTIHDWHFIFSKLHILSLDTLIGGIVRFNGVVVGLLGLIFSAWLLYKMATSTSSPSPKAVPPV